MDIIKLNNEMSIYSDSSKNVCLYTTIAIVLSIIFIISPINQYVFTAFLGKSVIILILLYTIYQMFKNVNYLQNLTNVSFSKDDIQTNIISSYIFSFFLLLLLFSVIQRLF